MKVLLRFDGSCDFNGQDDATGGYGWHVDDYESGSPIGEGFDCLSEEGMTNNVAEWTGLIRGLEWLACYKACRVEAIVIEGDSKMVIEQLLANWKCHKPHLQKLRDKAWDLLNNTLGGIRHEAYWIPREQNERADALSTRRKAPRKQRTNSKHDRICDFASV